ncbi:short-chain dehydrogenase [Marinicauda salina]|uniref:Short-chain dehydrogenase n=1 Tax=Marinicauda salina TaxID=2135793 RepID=A0A2U2BXT4_9PROT|nr:glucose 1-dehydrogenase [Marinicauda salina]PWE18789.1 short-chain dehydrogenase [Marinicauda salina]
MKSLENKTALVTGAARGIGAAIARRFAEAGATVIITDIDAGGAKSVAEGLGPPAVHRRLDVREEDQWRATAEWVGREFGRLDALVNNAGITGFLETPGPHDPEHLDLESWREVHRVNSDGVALGCKYAIGLMKAEGGAIVNISSRSGIVGIPGAAAYAASKAAVRNHTKSVALYCAQAGYAIRCNSIHPAAVMTEMWDAMLGAGAQRDAIMASIEAGVPMGRFGTPGEVAEAALYLASDASSYVTGTELHVDGGILAGAEAAPAKAE